jgi:ferredoxin-NADP reductase
MLEILLSALRHPSDYTGALHVHTLTFVEQRHEGGAYYSFIFTSDTAHSWLSGQHGILFLPTSKRDRGWRPFSVASSPHEGVIRIGTLIPEPHSEFKTSLLSLTPGTTVTFRGPFGEFHAADKPEKIVGVAGGIGITPFRALAYDIAQAHLPHTTFHLIYGTRDSYPYQAELDSWQTLSDNFTVEYLREPEAIQNAITNQWNIFGNQARYFISGSPGMINGIREQCQKLGVRRIVNDPFKGY